MMDTRTGKLYPSVEAALAADVPPEHIVEVRGPEAAIRALGRKVQRLDQLEKRLRRKRRRDV